MKALIVCEDDNVIEKITEATTASGYDNIIYRRAMKALDNVEEISPDVVIFNACDYPRHWKPFISYARAFLKKMPEVVLYAPKSFSDDEKKKADALLVKGVFSNINSDGIYKLKTLINTKKENNTSLYGVKILRDPRKEIKKETTFSVNSFSTKIEDAPKPKVNLFDTKSDSSTRTNLFDTKTDISPKINWFDKKIDDEPEIDFFNTKADSKPKNDSSGGIDLFSTKTDISPKINWFDKKFDDEQEIDFFNTKAPPTKKIKPSSDKKHSDTMMFTHPYSGAFVTGTIKSISADETLIDFSPDIKIQRLSAGDNINSLSLSTMRGIRSCKATIERIDDGLITVKVA